VAAGCTEADGYESPDKSITGREGEWVRVKGKCIEDSHTDTSMRQWGNQVAKGGTENKGAASESASPK